MGQPNPLKSFFTPVKIKKNNSYDIQLKTACRYFSQPYLDPDSYSVSEVLRISSDTNPYQQLTPLTPFPRDQYVSPGSTTILQPIVMSNIGQLHALNSDMEKFHIERPFLQNSILDRTSESLSPDQLWT